jgi:hypothetical protein
LTLSAYDARARQPGDACGNTQDNSKEIVGKAVNDVVTAYTPGLSSLPLVITALKTVLAFLEIYDAIVNDAHAGK